MAHWDEFSDKKSALQLKANSIRATNATKGYGKVQMAVVMSAPVPTSARDLNVVVQGIGQGQDFGEIRESDQREAFVFKVRFLPEAGKKLSADAALPCTDSLANSKNTTQSAFRLSLLPDCVIKAGFDGEPPNVGDTIVVTCYDSEFSSAPGLQTTEYSGMADPSLNFRQDYDPEENINQNVELQDLWDSNPDIVGTEPGAAGLGSDEPSNAQIDNNKVRFSFHDALAMKDMFGDIKDFIKSGEGTYESVYGSLTGYRDPVNNQKVTEMTLSYLIGSAMPRIFKKNKISTAAGAYQFLKGTLSETVAFFDANTPGWDSGPVIYNQETQDALVMHLILVKRPAMGNYILGLHDNYTEAGQQMAYEWASIPIQYSVKSPLASCNKIMQRGQGAYDGCSGNAVHKKKTPEKVIQILDKARREAAYNPTVAEILRKNNKERTGSALALAQSSDSSQTSQSSDPDSVVGDSTG